MNLLVIVIGQSDLIIDIGYNFSYRASLELGPVGRYVGRPLGPWEKDQQSMGVLL